MFWILASLVLLAVLVLLLLPLFRGRESEPRPSEHDLSVYRDQLDSVDSDVGRGVLAGEQADSARIEISRRILAANRRARAEPEGVKAGDRTTAVAALAIAVVTVGGSLGLYGAIGSPGLQDMPLDDRIDVIRAARMDQATAERLAFGGRPNSEKPAQFPDDQEAGRTSDAELLRQLREAVAERHGDVVGLRMLVRHEALAGNWPAARAAQQRLIMALGAEARDSHRIDLVAIMIRAAGGYVSREAEHVVAEILAREPANRDARHFAAVSLLQDGRLHHAVRIWQALLAEAPDSPMANNIRQLLALTAGGPPFGALDAPTVEFGPETAPETTTDDGDSVEPEFSGQDSIPKPNPE
ncbi:MAG: c-type cytochrome biogenesis protein CcmI [Paracoccaceae bacterium]|nr:c-type cytochrome biogenesis protein CcmI [Paracoccaceae bacterium]